MNFLPKCEVFVDVDYSLFNGFGLFCISNSAQENGDEPIKGENNLLSNGLRFMNFISAQRGYNAGRAEGEGDIGKAKENRRSSNLTLFRLQTTSCVRKTQEIGHPKIYGSTLMTNRVGVF